jgi:hypothetical protein
MYFDSEGKKVREKSGKSQIAKDIVSRLPNYNPLTIASLPISSLTPNYA